MRLTTPLANLSLACLLLTGCHRDAVPDSLWESSPAVRQLHEQTDAQGHTTTQIVLRPKGGDDAERFLLLATGDMLDVLQALYLHLPQQVPDSMEFRLQAPLVSRSGNSALVEILLVRFDTRALQALDWQHPIPPGELLERASQVEQLEPVARKLIDAYCHQPENASRPPSLCKAPPSEAPAKT